MADKKKAIGVAMGSAFMAGMAMVPLANAAQDPFALQSLQFGYMVADNHMGGKGAEAKCGQGKCGGMKSEAAAPKAGEAKCGQGKCGGMKSEAAPPKAGEAKCGQGKCGGMPKK